MNFSALIKWLYVVGTMGFSELAYERIRDAYDMKDRAKTLLDDCLQYAQFYNRDMDVWKEFNRNKCIDASAFPKLLEKSDVLLTTSEVATLIRDINVNGDSTITKEEIQRYLDTGKSHRSVRILFNCLQNFGFMANLTWFIGAIGYATAYYSTGNTQDVANTVSIIFIYFCPI